METQHITDPTYTPFEADDVCEVHMETSGHRGGIDVTVTWGVVDRDDGLEFMELTYNFPTWEQAGWFLHVTTRR
jgi:hypothetical protein